MSDAFLSLQRQAESVGRLIRDLNAADTRSATWEAPVVCRDAGDGRSRGTLVLGGVFPDELDSVAGAVLPISAVLRIPPRGCPVPVARTQEPRGQPSRLGFVRIPGWASGSRVLGVRSAEACRWNWTHTSCTARSWPATSV